jgi:hypothetical protein
VCNRAAAFIKLGMWGYAVADCARVLELPDLEALMRLKALQRMAQSCVELGWFGHASSVFDAPVRAGEAAFVSEMHASMALRKAAHATRMAELMDSKAMLTVGRTARRMRLSRRIWSGWCASGRRRG